MKHGNDNASAGGVFGFLLLIGIIFLMVALLSPITDEMNHANNQMTTGSGIPVSQERLDTMQYLIYGFIAIPLATVIAGGVNLIVNSIKERNQEV